MPMQQILLGAGGSANKVYIEDVFSTFLYKGDDANDRDIVNGIDLATEGGMVWFKHRGSTEGHVIVDSVGTSKDYYLRSNTNAVQAETSHRFNKFNSDGFQINGHSETNGSADGGKVCSWSFRKAKGFFDIVTYEGTSSAHDINHNLGCVPGCIIVKCLDNAQPWGVYHKGSGNTGALTLNGNSAVSADTDFWNNTTPTSTKFTVGGGNTTNYDGKNYVAYLFADGDDSDAQIFGDGGDESIIKTGSYQGALDTNLGWEPQFVLVKNYAGTGNWYMFDSMRGFAERETTNNGVALEANGTGAEAESGYGMGPLATGFQTSGGSLGNSDTDWNYIYIAIRRPMKTPEDATKVFDPVAYTGDTSGHTVSISPSYTDLTWIKRRGSTDPFVLLDRLRTGREYIQSNSDSQKALFDANDKLLLGQQNGFGLISNTTGYTNSNGENYISWNFKRAPGFFDIVCYKGTAGTGDGVQNLSHNLGVVPEMMLIKCRDADENWPVYHTGMTSAGYHLRLNTNVAEEANATMWDSTAPTASVFTVGANDQSNKQGERFVAYLFASLPGISKVGTYSGTGNDINVDCGFTGSARFVMAKRVNDPGNWYVWDSARGIVSGDEPWLDLREASAEQTTDDYIDPFTGGFTITSEGTSGINASGNTYVYLAIA